MPSALVCKPITETRYGYEIKCYRCGHVFESFAESLKIGVVHCGICWATNRTTPLDKVKG